MCKNEAYREVYPGALDGKHVECIYHSLMVSRLVISRAASWKAILKQGEGTNDLFFDFRAWHATVQTLCFLAGWRKLVSQGNAIYKPYEKENGWHMLSKQISKNN